MAGWSGLAVLAWCLAVIGTILLLVSPIVSAHLITHVLVAAGIFLVLGAGSYVVCRLRH
jgi:hypothetical protein